jgi:hypothetical protein
MTWNYQSTSSKFNARPYKVHSERAWWGTVYCSDRLACCCTAVGRGGRATLKMLRRKSKTQFVKQERNTQNAIALLNYLKHMAPQQLMLRMQVFTKKILSTKNASATF